MHPITRYRRAKGFTQTGLAEAMSVSLNTVQRWERGRRPRPRHLQALAELLGVSALQLDEEILEWGSKQGEKEAA